MTAPRMDPYELTVLTHLVMVSLAAAHPRVGGGDVRIRLPDQSARRIYEHLCEFQRKASGQSAIERACDLGELDPGGKRTVHLLTRIRTEEGEP